MMKKPPTQWLPRICTCLTLTYLPMLGLASTIDPTSRVIGYVGMPAPTKHDISSNAESIFVIDYSSLDWSGNLHKLAISNTGDVSDTDAWVGGAAAQVNGQGWDARKIITFNGNNKIPFRWNSLSSAQQTSLGSENILKYLRGDRSNEGKTSGRFRVRGSVLGDLIHTTPIYWEDPAQQSSGSYIPSTQCDGAPCKTVFVSGNGGMLHAFDANTGKERFAFIPKQLFSGLASLSTQNYTHRYFVDGQLAIRNYANTVLLAGSLGRGGKGLYGLNVTNPNPSSELLAASNLLWEISNTSTGFANLGYVDGRIVLSEYINASNKVPALITGNGYDNTGNYQASLLIIDAQTGAKLKEISTNTGSSSTPNGLSAPTLIDTNFDGVADIAYAGDLVGNLWKFDLLANTATKLHTASPALPITMAPSVTRHPQTGMMVVFATGKLFTESDKNNTASNYVYGIWDGAPTANTTLQTQTLTEVTTSSIRVRTASNNAMNWAIHKGWQVKLPKSGERVVGGDNALISQGSFRFMTRNPTVNTLGSPPGENWWMELDPTTGSSTRQIRFDLNRDRQLNNADMVNGFVPVGRHMGGGTRSQLLSLYNGGYAYFVANFDKNSESDPIGRGVAGGHFDVEFYRGPQDVCINFDPVSGSNSQTTCYINYNNGYEEYQTYHTHEYDDKFDKTGVNFLNASSSVYNLSGAPLLQADPNRSFKVLLMNQYLSPAAMLNIGRTDYSPSSSNGYVSVKSFQTRSGLSVASLPSYTLDTIGSLVINFPTDGFSVADWWGNGDVRAGTHTTSADCVFMGGADNGNYPIFPSALADMYTPVVPPANGSKVAGILATTAANNANRAVRHNGALTLQIVDASITDSDIEQNVAGRPEYGYRVKQSRFFSKVIAEYSIFWHHPRDVCYHDSTTSWYDGSSGGNGFAQYNRNHSVWNTPALMNGTGWTSDPPSDESNHAVVELTPAAGSTDPKLEGYYASPDLLGSGGSGSGSSGTAIAGTTSSSSSNVVVGGEVLSMTATVTTTTNTGNCGSDCAKTGGYAPPVGRINWRELFK